MLRALVLLLVLTPLGFAQTAADLGSQIVVTLQNGDVVSGTLVESNVYTIVLDHELFGGTLTIARTAVQSFTGAAAAAEEQAAEEAGPAAAAAEQDAADEVWSGSFDLGLSGTGGNTDTETFRSSLNMRGEDEDAVDILEFTYQLTRTDGIKDQDRFFGKYRREWNVDDSSWKPFAQVTGELDEFKDWTYRVAAHAGASRHIIDEADEEFSLRVGLGASKEVGATDDEVKPEGLIGATYRNELTATSRFVAEADYYPELDDAPEWRGIASAAYEALLTDDPDDNPWTLKTGVSTVYDSTPGAGFRKNDYAYFTNLGVIF